ncbi:MAG: O-antigen ligase family protein, partial [Clostridium sp.]
MKFIMDKKKIGLCIIILALTAIFTVTKLGIKDGATFTMSVALIIIMIGMSREDMKKSIYIFIISLPILVTARKLFYLDLGIVRLNFESMMIIYFFLFNYKYIINKIKSAAEIKSVRRFNYYIILFVIASYTSCFFSKDILNSIGLNTTSILIPIILMITVVGVFDKVDIKKIVYSLIISINLSCFYGYMQMLSIGTSLSAIKQARDNVTFGYHNTNIFVVIALLIYPLLLNELFYKKNSRKENIFLVISLMIQSVAIALTFSRGAWLSLALVFVAVLFSKKYRVLFIAITIVGVLSASTLLPIIMNRGNSNTGSLLTNQSTTARLQSICTSSEIIKDNIFGVGYGEFNNSDREYAVKGYFDIPEEIRNKMRSPFYTLENAHNFFLHIGVELGSVT